MDFVATNISGHTVIGQHCCRVAPKQHLLHPGTIAQAKRAATAATISKKWRWLLWGESNMPAARIDTKQPD
jgi:hypothetical protein